MVLNSYIIPYCRPNKDGSINYKFRHYNIINEIKFPCSASITILNDEVLRGSFDHNHEPLSEVFIRSKIAQYEEKVLAETRRQPLSQIHSEVQSKLVKELTLNQLEEETEKILDEIAEVFPDFQNGKSGLNK